MWKHKKLMSVIIAAMMLGNTAAGSVVNAADAGSPEPGPVPAGIEEGIPSGEGEAEDGGVSGTDGSGGEQNPSESPDKDLRAVPEEPDAGKGGDTGAPDDAGGGDEYPDGSSEEEEDIAGTALRDGGSIVPISINITHTYDDIDYRDGYVYGKDLYLGLRDGDGRYIILNADNEYDGVSDDPVYFIAEDISTIYLPEGEYTLSFRDENTEELADRHILGTYEDFLEAPENIKLRYSPALDVSGEDSNLEISAVVIHPDRYFFNVDAVGGTEPARVRFPATYDGQNDSYYHYTRTEEDGDVVYTYDMENGTYTWLDLEPGKRTVIKDAPLGASAFDIIYPVKDGTCVFGFALGSQTVESEEPQGIWMANSTSLGSISSFIVANAENPYSVKTYHKYAVHKDPSMARFCLTAETYDGEYVDQNAKYVLDHYDTYEYRGTVYKNVYIPRRETKALYSTDEDTFIDTDEDGEFTVLYPTYTYNSSGSWTSPNYYLYEAGSEPGTFNPSISPFIYSSYSRVDVKYKYELYDKRNGNDINGAALDQVYASQLSIEDIGIRNTMTQSEWDSLENGTEQIQNMSSPFIEKEIAQYDAAEGYKFPVDIYAYGDNGLEKVATVYVSEGERKYLIPEEIEGLTYDHLRAGIYIKEQAMDNWTASSYENGVQNGTTGTYYISWQNRYDKDKNGIIIHNARQQYGLVITKRVEGGTGTHTHTFKVRLWDEQDGEEYPIKGFHINGNMAVTDENGECTISVTTNGDAQASLGFGVPAGCHYSVEEISSTLGKYTVTGSDRTGIVSPPYSSSAWVNSESPADVTVSKTDINGHEIAGAQLEITGRADGDLQDIEPISWTSVEGEDKTVQLYPGSYTLKETAVPESGAYIKAADISFTVDKYGNVKVADQDVDKVTMIDDYAPVRLTVDKEMMLSYKDFTSHFRLSLWTMEGSQRQPLAGYQIEGTEYVTDGDGCVEFQIDTPPVTGGDFSCHASETFTLPRGIQYRVEELPTEDPNVNVFGTSSFQGTLSSDRTAGFRNIMNNYIEFEKVDQDGVYMPGAVMQILDDQGNVVKEWTTAEQTERIYLRASVTSLGGPQYYMLHEKTKPGNAVNTAADIRFMVIPDTQEKGQLLTADGNIFKPVEKLSVCNIDRTKTHSLTISKEYDDNGTGVVLADDIEFAFHVLIKNLPVEYMQAGLDVEEAYIGEFSQLLPLPKNTGGFYEVTSNYRPVQKTDHVAGWDGTIRHNFDYEEGGQTAYASFVIWIKPGESVTIKDLPEGAVWEVFEIGSNKTSVELFDVRYEPASGTINGADAATTVTNVQKTIDFKLKKDIYGYDDGTVFYVEFRSDDNAGGGSYKELNQTFIGSDGQERAFFHEDGQFRALIPFRPEDGEMVIKLPVRVHWFINERAPARGADMDDYTYEDLVDLVFHNNSILENPVLYTCTGQDSDGIRDYAAVTALLTSGTNRTQDFYAHYQNRSAVVAFEKKDSEGAYLPGAHMAVIDKETEEIVEEWVTDSGKPHTWNISGYVDSDGYKTFEGKQFILRELDAPEGYQKADDIEFTLKAHVDTTTSWSQAFEDSPVDVEYFYPYMDTGDGREKLLLTMVDSCTAHDVEISKTDVNGNEIEGAQLKVTGREEGSSEDIVPIEWTSEAGKNKTISVRPGTYTLHEEAVPESGAYIAAADITFTVDKDGNVKIADQDVDKVTMVDDYHLVSLKISKTVEGSLGSRDKQFSFSLKLTGPDGTPYRKPAVFKKGEEEKTVTPDETGTITFTLSHGEEIELSGIVYGTSYEVSEADYSAEGYRAESVNAKGRLTAETTETGFTNTKDAPVPTGAAMPGTGLPLAAALLGIAAAAVIIFKRVKDKA